MKNLLVVGNGSIGIHNASELYINNHTGYFLKNLKRSHVVTFAQGLTEYNKDNNLQNFELKKNEIEYSVLPRTKTKGFIPSVFGLLKSNDFVYLFYPGTVSKIIALIAILIKKPIGLYIRGQYYNQNILDRFILNRAKFILTVSPSFVKGLNKFCSRVEVIKPMIDIGFDDIKRDRNYYNINKKNLLFVGRVEERKGIKELLEIAKTLKQHKLNFTLNVIGGGELFNAVKAEISKNELDDQVILHGLISDKTELKRMYDNADIFVFTSHDEGFPRVLYEAMASALPIFTTFVGGISGRMVHLENCIEIPVKDSIKASENIIKHLHNDCILNKIGQNGLKTVEKIIDGQYATHEQLVINQLKFEN